MCLDTHLHASSDKVSSASRAGCDWGSYRWLASLLARWLGSMPSLLRRDGRERAARQASLEPLYRYREGWGSNATLLALFSGIVIHHPVPHELQIALVFRAHPGFLVRSTR